MKNRFLLLILFAASLLVALTTSAYAQEPPPQDQQLVVPLSGPSPALPPDCGDLQGAERANCLSDWAKAMGAANASAPESPQAFSLGKPGLNYRYVQTFGTADVPYKEDTTHLNDPTGVAVDGGDVWIVEGPGRRALRYGADGTFKQQIGKAGFRYPDGFEFQYLQDVAVDPSGNVWVVDNGRHRVEEFGPDGAPLRDSNGNQLGFGQAWNCGQDNDHLCAPIGIAFDAAGNIYVSDQWNHRVQVFDSSRNWIHTIGVSGQSGADAGHLNNPAHISIDSNNHLYIADSGNNRVLVFDVTNPTAPVRIKIFNPTRTPGSGNTQLNWPMGVTADPARNRIFIADANNRRVQVFRYDTYAYVRSIVDPNPAWVSDVAVNAAGQLFVSEPWDSWAQVREYNANLALIRTFGTTGKPYLTNNKLYNRPKGVAIGPDGSIYIGEEGGKRLIKLNAAGTPVWTIGTAGVWGGDNYNFSYITDVDTDTAGRIYVTDPGNCRVMIYNPDRSFYARLGSGCGSGSTQFSSYIRGLAVGPDGRIYVADTGNVRIQVFDANRNYIGTLGTTGVSGSGNYRFNNPVDVDVDKAGNIYVVDQNNHRVQMYNSSRTYLRTFGVTGQCGYNQMLLCYPTAVTTDKLGKVFILTSWGSYVEVFTSTGAYRATIGGAYNDKSGGLRDGNGLATDAAGNLYIADRENDRIQKFAPGVPDWVQVNINGMAFPPLSGRALAAFGSYLYAGELHWNADGGGTELWRMDANGVWSQVATGGFGNPHNLEIVHFLEFGGKLYAATYNCDETCTTSDGGEIWRSSTGDSGSWEAVVTGGFGDDGNGEVRQLGVFGGKIYAGTARRETTHGLEIWRSSTGDSGSWEQVVSDGFGSGANTDITSFAEFKGQFYTAVSNASGVQIWRSASGDSGTWTQANTSGFGNAHNAYAMALQVYGDYLYASTRNTFDGAQIWRTSDGTNWTQVGTNGFGNPNNLRGYGLFVYKNELYAVFDNSVDGSEIWKTTDGTNWSPVMTGGWGDSNNGWADYWNRGAAVYNNELYIEVAGYMGEKIWKYLK